jgi:hypothetical protein
VSSHVAFTTVTKSLLAPFLQWMNQRNIVAAFFLGLRCCTCTRSGWQYCKWAYFGPAGLGVKGDACEPAEHESAAARIEKYAAPPRSTVLHLYNTKYGPIRLMHDINIIKYEPTKQKTVSICFKIYLVSCVVALKTPFILISPKLTNVVLFK